MNNKYNPTMLKKLLWIKIIILLLSSCQSINILSNTSKDNIELGKYEESKENSITSLNVITERITNLYKKKSLTDYIGDIDKEKIAIAAKNAADTNELQLFMNEESGIKGKAEVIQSRIFSTLELGKKEGIRECKTIRQTIILRDKREIIESIKLCKGPDGWG